MADSFITTGLMSHTGKYHGLLYRDRPAPSGIGRYMLVSSTTHSYDTEYDAAMAMNDSFPQLTPIDLTKCSTEGVFNIDLPRDGTITVIEPRHARELKDITTSSDPTPHKTLPSSTRTEQDGQSLSSKTALVSAAADQAHFSAAEMEILPPQKKVSIEIYVYSSNHKELDIKLSFQQLQRLIAEGRIVPDSGNDDPDLQAIYTHYAIIKPEGIKRAQPALQPK